MDAYNWLKETSRIICPDVENGVELSKLTPDFVEVDRRTRLFLQLLSAAYPSYACFKERKGKIVEKAWTNGRYHLLWGNGAGYFILSDSETGYSVVCNGGKVYEISMYCPICGELEYYKKHIWQYCKFCFKKMRGALNRLFKREKKEEVIHFYDGKGLMAERTSHEQG